MDIVPCRLVKQTAALFTKTYLRRLLNLQRDTTISADTLTTFAINDMVDHVTALRVMKERFELSHLHLLALQRCNKQSQLGRISTTSYTRVKSVALTLDGFHISSWLFRLIKLLVNLQRFPDAYNLEKREVENAVYTLLLTLDPSYFDAEEIFFIWQLTVLCSSWTQIESMTEHFALRDALETLSSEQFAELLNLLCNIRHNSFTPEDQEAFVQLKKRYPTFTKEEYEHEQEKYAKVQEQRTQSREASVQAYSWERTRSNPMVQSMCVGDEVERFLQDRCVIVSHGYRILREVIGEKYTWERCIEVLRDTSLDAMFARERIISILPLLASSTQFWPSVELNPKHHHHHRLHESEEQEEMTKSSKREKETEQEEKEKENKCKKEQECTLSNTTSIHQDSSAECVNTTSNQSTFTTTSTTLTNTDTSNTQHDRSVMNAETNKSINEKITKLFYKPVVYGKPGRGALLYEELPWLFDEKSWRSYFPVSGSDALRELYTVNINQFAFRVAAVYGKVNVELPNYVRESYEKPIEANLWRHICERDVDTIGQFALMSIRRFDIIHAPFVFSEQLRKHMEHVVRDRWGVVLSKTTEAKEESSNMQENDTHKINTSSSSSSVSSSTNSNYGKENNLKANTESMEHVVVSDNMNTVKQDNGNKEEQESECSKLIASDVNNNNNSNEKEFMDIDDKDDVHHDNESENVKINSQESIETFSDSSDNENKSTEETSTNKKKTYDNNLDSIGRDENNKENSSNGVNECEERDEMDYELESEPTLPAYVHGAREREMREQRIALKRLSRSNHHHILKTLLIAVESRCSLEVIKPLLHTLIKMMQEILKPTVINKWNALYAQRVPLAQDACRIDWATIEASIKNNNNNYKTEQERISKSNDTNNNKNGNAETNKESKRRFNHDVYVSSGLYDCPIDLEWSLWSIVHTTYTLTMMESCFHGKPILSSDIRGMFYKPCNRYNSSSNGNIVSKPIRTIINNNKESEQLEVLPPLMDVQSDAEAAAMKTQLDKLCLASLRGAIATDRITARSLCNILMCAPQTLREMTMMYELLSLAALHARDGFSRSQLFCLVHSDHIFEADETWRRHVLKVALDLPIRMWM